MINCEATSAGTERSNVTFDVFVKEIFEPYLLKEVGKRFQEAQGQLENFVEEKQLMFQEEMVKSATSWMREQQESIPSTGYVS
jgi:hypothetical protein